MVYKLNDTQAMIGNRQPNAFKCQNLHNLTDAISDSPAWATHDSDKKKTPFKNEVYLPPITTIKITPRGIAAPPSVISISAEIRRPQAHRGGPSLDCRVAAPTAAALDRVEHPADPVLEQVGHVAEGVAVREQVPAAGAVASVVEPGAEDEVGCDGEEESVCVSSLHLEIYREKG